MPQMAPLVLTDRASPPVDHVFNPRGKEGGVATYAESTGVPLGDRRITMRDPVFSNGRAKVTIKMAFPVIQTTVVSGVAANTVLRTNYADLVFNFDQSSTLQERDDMIGQLYDMIRRDDNPVVGETLINLSGQY